MHNPALRQQSLARPMSEAETALAAALEAIFAEGTHDPAAVAVALQARGVKRPSGSAAAWDSAALEHELAELNQALDTAYARSGIGA